MQIVKFVARNTATGTACGSLYSNMLVVNIPVSKPAYSWTMPTSNRSKEVPAGAVYSENLVCCECSSFTIFFKIDPCPPSFCTQVFLHSIAKHARSAQPRIQSLVHPSNRCDRNLFQQRRRVARVGPCRAPD